MMMDLIFNLLVLIALAAAVIYLKTGNNAQSQKKEDLVDKLKADQQDLERRLRDEFERSRESSLKTMKEFSDHVLSRMSEIAQLQKNQLDSFAKQLNVSAKNNEDRQDKLRESVEKRLQQIQEDNGKKLEQMRQTVDEKLQATLEKRLGESFKFVSDRLEQVHKGLGEMQQLAVGVGDLKKVLSNVKTRGTWGEIQLEAILEEMLSPEQYERNVQTRPNSRDFVEFAIKLPGKTDNADDVVWLPIDAKFPQDFYASLLDAQESGNLEQIELAAKQLESRFKLEAKSLKEKYISPPQTTDFGILFLPTEGLYAEAIRRAGLHETLQRDHRILLAGPTTLAALLNSLQMGFRTLAIEKRSSEVWQVLGTVKAEFGKFGDLLDKTKKKLQETTNVIDLASRKTRTIARKLRDVEVLPEAGTESETPIEIGELFVEDVTEPVTLQ